MQFEISMTQRDTAASDRWGNKTIGLVVRGRVAGLLHRQISPQCRVAWVVLGVLVFCSTARAASLIDSLFVTQVEITGNSHAGSVMEIGGKGDGQLSTLLSGQGGLDNSAFAFTGDGSSSRAAVSAFVDGGTYTATASWSGTYVKTSNMDELTYFMLAGGGLGISENVGNDESAAPQVAEWNIEVKLDGMKKFSNQVRVEGRHSNYASSETGDKLPGGTFDISDSEAAYGFSPLNSTISLAGIALGDTFQVEHSVMATVTNAIGEADAGSGISLQTSVTPAKCEDIVKTVPGSADFNAITTQAVGQTMEAWFDPNFDLTLDQAEEACEVDHFNWV